MTNRQFSVTAAAVLLSLFCSSETQWSASAFSTAPGSAFATRAATTTLSKELSFALFASDNDNLQQEAAASSSQGGLLNRRSFFLATAATTLSVASQLPSPASAGLLDEFGADPNNFKIEQKVEPKAVAVATAKTESRIEPNLRSNYYYPTNKKRYLPRIQKCNDRIGEVATAIGNNDWDVVTDFATNTADDTVLPLKLYTSSLTGGGTNVKVSYTKTMNKDANVFEAAQKALVKAASKKDTQAAATALEQMAEALQDYRQVAGLTGPDGGGDIPSVDEIRRAACRVQGRTFEKTIKSRDSRLQQQQQEDTVESVGTVVAQSN